MNIIVSNRNMFRSYDHLQGEIYYIRPKHVAVTDYNIQTSVVLDGNPEPDSCIFFTVFIRVLLFETFFCAYFVIIIKYLKDS
jgi:hypothetical protein